MKTKRIIVFGILFFTSYILLSQTTKNTLKVKISGNGYSDETILRFIPGATHSFDAAYDAWKLFSPNPNVPAIFTKDISGSYSINSFPDFTKDTSLTLHVTLQDTGIYTFNFSTLFPFDPDIVVIFEDSLKQQIKEPLLGQNYTVRIDSLNQILNHSHRFKLHFYLAPQIQVISPECSYDSAKLIVRKIGNNNWNYSVLNSSGSIVKQRQVNSEADSVSGIPPGNYRLQMHYFILNKHAQTITINPGINVKASFTIKGGLNSYYVGKKLQFLNGSTNYKELEWDFGDQSGSKSIDPIYTYNSEGNYTVALKAINGNCIDTTNKNLDIKTFTTGITSSFEEKKESQIYYANQFIHVKWTSSTEHISSIEIYDLSGKIRASYNPTHQSDHYTLPFDINAKGIYVCLIQTENQNFFQEKVITF